jgi:hypothetical protein
MEIISYSIIMSILSNFIIAYIVKSILHGKFEYNFSIFNIITYPVWLIVLFIIANIVKYFEHKKYAMARLAYVQRGYKIKEYKNDWFYDNFKLFTEKEWNEFKEKLTK